MLTYAIGLIQDVQLFCFAIVFVCMALQDRSNRSLRYLCFAYLAGAVGGILELGAPVLPAWIASGIAAEAAPIGYACIHASIVYFVGRGERTRWVSVALIAAGLPFYMFWRAPAVQPQSATLVDAILAVQTALSAWLLFTTPRDETRRPRMVMGGFLALYSAVETSRVIVFLVTHKLPGQVSPAIEIASGIVYIISCSVLPLAFIWMMNSRLHADLRRQSLIDPLTQVLNRRGLTAAADRELARCQRFGVDLAVVIADIDHFKRLNDAYGHARGDFVLSSVATLFQQMLRKTDSIGRLGGEEFVILLPGTGTSGALELVERLRTALESYPFMLGQKVGSVTASFGITSHAGRNTMTWDMLLPEADTAMYAAKRAGRNRSHLFSASSSAPEPPPSPGRLLSFKNPADDGF